MGGNRDRDSGQSSASYAPNRFGRTGGGGWRDKMGASSTRDNYRRDPEPETRRDKNSGINVMDAASSSEDSDSSSSDDARSKRGQRKQRNKKGKKKKKEKKKKLFSKKKKKKKKKK